jgi:hypothetical protein
MALIGFLLLLLGFFWVELLMVAPHRGWCQALFSNIRLEGIEIKEGDKTGLRIDSSRLIKVVPE